MFKKVLITEDFDTINIALTQTLQKIGIGSIENAKYCDDALLKIKKANQENQPFDLLICDLSFNLDHRDVKIKSGDELIELVRIEQPNLKIIVYSIEDKSFRIKPLFENNNINAFVHKGRNSLSQLKTAIETIVEENKQYISPHLAEIIKDKPKQEIDKYDLQLIKQLSLGFSQEKMDERFRELGITPNGKSTIEKRVYKLKDYFKANNTTHLISIAKDLGII
jgi:two-component system capsular synthesis response regulator RcsB